MRREHPIVREGLIAGGLGAAAVAIWFLLLDLTRGQVFFTPAALGSALLYGARGIQDVQITPATVLLYTLIHVVAFLAVGFIAAKLILSAEEEPRVWLLMGVAFVTFEVATIALLALTSSWLLDRLHLWTVLVANVIAAVVMGVFLWKRHPLAQANLRSDIEEIDVRGSRPPVR